MHVYLHVAVWPFFFFFGACSYGFSLFSCGVSFFREVVQPPIVFLSVWHGFTHPHPSDREIEFLCFFLWSVFFFFVFFNGLINSLWAHDWHGLKFSSEQTSKSDDLRCNSKYLLVYRSREYIVHNLEVEVKMRYKFTWEGFFFFFLFFFFFFFFFKKKKKKKQWQM